jgi:hypothetical protein
LSIGGQRSKGHVMVVRASPDRTADWRGARRQGMLGLMIKRLWARSGQGGEPVVFVSSETQRRGRKKKRQRKKKEDGDRDEDEEQGDKKKVYRRRGTFQT